MSKSAADEKGLALINELHRLELRSEQLEIHLSSLQPCSAEVRTYSAELVKMQRKMTRIKARCLNIEPALILSRDHRERLH